MKISRVTIFLTRKYKSILIVKEYGCEFLEIPREMSAQNQKLNFVVNVSFWSISYGPYDMGLMVIGVVMHKMINMEHVWNILI